MESSNALGKRLLTARAQARLSQEEAAKLLGVSQQRYSYWETGKSAPRPTGTEAYRELMRSVAAFIGETVPETVRLAYFPSEPRDVRHHVSSEVHQRIVRLELVVARLEQLVQHMAVASPYPWLGGPANDRSTE